MGARSAKEEVMRAGRQGSNQLPKRQDLSRRDLLRAGLGVGAGALLASSIGCSDDSQPARPDVADGAIARKDAGDGPSTRPEGGPGKDGLGKDGGVDLLKVGYLLSDHHAPLFVAITKGFLQKQGVKVEATKYDSGGTLTVDLKKGSIDLILAGVVPVILAADPSSLTDVNTTPRIIAAIHNNGSGLVVRSDLDVKDVAGLVGKKIAIPGAASIQALMLSVLLKEKKIDAKSVTRVIVPSEQMLDSLASKAIDAIMGWEPLITRAVKAGQGKCILRFEEVMPGHPCCVATTTLSRTKDSRYIPLLLGYLKAHIEAIELIKTNLDEVAGIVGSDQWLKSATEIEKEAMQRMTFSHTPDKPFLEGTRKFSDEAFTNNLLTKPINTDDLYDLSLLNKALGT